MLSLNSSFCDSKKSRLIKEQEASGLLSSLGIRVLFSQIPALVPLLFQRCKMNEVRNQFLLAGNEFMTTIHLKQHRSFMMLADQNKEQKERKSTKISDSRRFKVYLSKRNR